MAGFDVNAVLGEVTSTLNERVDELYVQISGEKHDASEAALTYARHLADGGDPWVHPEAKAKFVPPLFALNMVYRAWNEARGSTNPVAPINNRGGWKVGELLHQNVGHPISFEQLKTAYQGDRRYGAGADAVAGAVIAAQTEELIVRKTKVGGKVAYILRPKREGEERASSTWDFPQEVKAA